MRKSKKQTENTTVKPMNSYSKNKDVLTSSLNAELTAEQPIDQNTCEETSQQAEAVINAIAVDSAVLAAEEASLQTEEVINAIAVDSVVLTAEEASQQTEAVIEAIAESEDSDNAEASQQTEAVIEAIAESEDSDEAKASQQTAEVIEAIIESKASDEEEDSQQTKEVTSDSEDSDDKKTLPQTDKVTVSMDDNEDLDDKKAFKRAKKAFKAFVNNAADWEDEEAAAASLDDPTDDQKQLILDDLVNTLESVEEMIMESAKTFTNENCWKSEKDASRPGKKTKKDSTKDMFSDKQASLYWKCLKNIKGYQIEYSRKRDFSDSNKQKIKKYKDVEKLIKKLKDGKKYYVRIRIYATVKKEKYYSDWSKVKTVKA